MKIKLLIVVGIVLAVLLGLGIKKSLDARAENQARMERVQAEMREKNPRLLEAILESNKELELKLQGDKRNAPWWFDLGTNKKNIGDYIGAERALKKAIKYDRESITALNNLGLLYQEVGEYRQAEVMFRQIVDRQPYFEDGYILLAELYEGTDYRPLEEAERILLFGLEVNPENKGLWLTLARYYERNGQPIKANETYAKLEELGGNLAPVPQPIRVDTSTPEAQFEIQ